MSAKNWCFTLNNYTNDECTLLANLFTDSTPNPVLSYLVYGREIGSSGTPHLQGYVQFPNRVSLARCRRLISDRAHFEPARGTPRQASDYCKKDNDYEEFGTMQNATQGRRNDWEDLKTFVLDYGSVPADRVLAGHFPALYSRSNKLREICAAFLPEPNLIDGEPRIGFQKRICDIVENPCTDDRKVHFVVDHDGNSGKSWLCGYLLSKHPDRVQVLSVGKRDDLALVIDVTKDVFLFDVPRGSMEFLQYSILEKLKDRMIFSPKYASSMKILQHLPHVVVFANEDPDRTKMTADRYKVINLMSLI